MQRYMAAALVLTITTTLAQSTLDFDVTASIKRNTSGSSAMNVPPASPGHVVSTNATVSALVARAYPSSMGARGVQGLPSWAQTERYDVEARTIPSATRDELTKCGEDCRRPHETGGPIRDARATQLRPGRCAAGWSAGPEVGSLDTRLPHIHAAATRRGADP